MRYLVSVTCALLVLGALTVRTPVYAGDNPFISEIRMFAGNFAPRGWAFCDGQLLAVSQNEALFSLLGTTYGGDGRTTFALPDLRGRAPVHFGQGPGLAVRQLGQAFGAETETLVRENLVHSHTLHGSMSQATETNPTNNLLGSPQGSNIYAAAGGAEVVMDASSIGDAAGGGQPHQNIQPSIAINCIIALQGTFPSRN